MLYNGKSHLEMHDLGVALFQETTEKNGFGYGSIQDGAPQLQVDLQPP